MVPKFHIRHWDQSYNDPVCRPRDDASGHTHTETSCSIDNTRGQQLSFEAGFSPQTATCKHEQRLDSHPMDFIYLLFRFENDNLEM